MLIKQPDRYVNEIIKVCSIECLTIEIKLVLPTFQPWTVHKIIEYLMLGLLSSLWNIYHSTTAYYFLTHPVVALCYTCSMVCPSVCLSQSWAVLKQPIEMPFGRQTRVGPRNKVLGWVPDTPVEWAVLELSPSPLWSVVYPAWAKVIQWVGGSDAAF